ncbi:MAG TPA: ABC transporter permease subunit [Solirubrobacteraceae bacterium]|nr:ABC transporter permease subunit [Solirubrobacteraceae bacterium]
MATDIARLDLHNRRRSLIGYTVGLALYMLVIVVLYPAFKHSTELNKLTQGNSALAAVFGATGTLTSPAGWVDVNAYVNFLPLIMLLLTIGYGADAIAGQNEDGTLGLLLVLPLTRPTILAQKIATMIAQALTLALTAAACVYIGRAFDVTLNPWHVATATLAILALSVDLGLIALALGTATGSRGTAIGIATALAVGSYLLSSLAAAVAWLKPTRFASLFYWADGNHQLAQGAGLTSFAVLAAVAIATALATNTALRHLDVR